MAAAMEAPSRWHIRGAFAFLIGAVVVATVAGGPLSWDGAYLLFKSLDLQSPCLPHGRYSLVVLEVPVVLASRLTDNLRVLELVFGLVYAMIPLVALWGSWRVVKSKAPQLVIWPFLGVCLGSLCGQFFFVSECLIALHLTWPLLLVAITGRWAKAWPWALALVVFLFFLHPVVTGLLVLVSLTSVLRGLRRPEQRWDGWVAAGVLLVIAAARGLLSARLAYEADSAAELLAIVQRVGPPPLAYWAALLAGAAVCSGAIAGRERGHWERASFLLLSVAAVAFLVWASAPANWRDELNYRFVAPLCALPFYAFAIGDGLVWPAASSASGRSWLMLLSAGVFTLVLSVQSLLWWQLRGALLQAVNGAESCIALDSLDFARRSALSWWSTAPYSILLQGRSLRNLVLTEGGCRADDIQSVIRMYPLGPRPRVGGGTWFDLARAGLGDPAALPAAAALVPPTPGRLAPRLGSPEVAASPERR